MAVAALVSAMNPSINATQDSEELAIVQKELLWILYENGHLGQYPMAIGNLGDLEDICPSLTPRKSPIELFYEAIAVAKKSYADHHVYPYTYLAGYLYRNGRFKEALKTWADAAQVVKQYNYTRDDEEIYKEFLEIANELIPHMVRVVSAGGCEPSGMSARPLLQDPECFAYLLRFYDGLCGWEEGSATPVLHIGWAKPLVATIAKFPHYIRAKVDIKADINEENEEPEDDDDDEEEVVAPTAADRDVKPPAPKSGAIETAICDNNSRKNNHKPKATDVDDSDVHSEASLCHSESELIKSLVKDMDAVTGEPNPTIAALAAACSENILNPRFLLGQDIENAFTSAPPTGATTTGTDSQDNSNASTPTSTPTTSGPALPPAAATTQHHVFGRPVNKDLDRRPSRAPGEEKTAVTLSSQKIAGLKHLLLADKLNTSAIQLQLTAQSQVDTKKRYRHSGTIKGGLLGGPEFDFVATTTTTLSRTSKRIRRE
ncbi:unnamed protein product [Medioppia subpectinata]|uniref:Menin n=1 Tax=Medioppia subpectinata TaxID=1979941 RepID=A0A7R9KZL7_9ACAR|nr:unnamed protein product [Medioppia subpectinata]CAG2112544.1 unnamed protein product [Medioppia subpectinata]